ncbi:MAG: methylmalonyl-CoA mutase family protein [Thermodesulfobacteriota bacterium]|nr:methylmalonyl-CoA mutase family protein [Thermodesulfobacteriota bacterium]
MWDEKDLKELEEIKKDWEEKCLKPALEDKPERKEEFLTDIGLNIERVYTPQDLYQIDFDYKKDLSFPGQYPFTRGITPTMYRSEPWIIRAYSGFGEPESCNKRYKKLIQWGVDEIVMAVDLPTQVGYDSDHLIAKGEVGKVGVAIDTLRDMEILFDDIPLNKLKRISMLGNSFAPVALSLFIALGEKQGLKPSDFVVDLQNDILKEYVARGTYIFPVRPSIRVAADVIGYCARHARHWYPCTLCANHINAAGAGSTKATAFALANGVCYINHLLDRGYKIDEIAPLFTMFLDERSDFFVAICNFRAARKVWAKIMRERMKAQDLRSTALKITAYAHGGETLLEPINNVVRITLAALAYVLGGVRFLYNASYDEVLGTPTEEAAKISVRTHQILAHELGITHTVDPLGGSYFIESLTAQIEKQIYEEFLKVEAMGGAIAAIEKGYYLSAITDGANRRQREFDTGKRVAIGVNKYRTDSEIPFGAFRIDPAIEQKQIERLNQVKKERNKKTVRETLEYVREVAEGDGNLVQPVLEAVRAYATVGEICDVLRAVFGEYLAREYFSPTG